MQLETKTKTRIFIDGKEKSTSGGNSLHMKWLFAILEIYGPTKIVFVVCCTTTNFTDVLGILDPFSHFFDTVVFCKLTHVIFMISQIHSSLRNIIENSLFCNKHSERVVLKVYLYL